jgi:O-methyltransferase
MGKSGDPLPSHFDTAAKAIIRRVRPRTMTKPIKLFGLIEATRYVVRHEIPGDIVECGVWRGGSMQAAALALLDAGVTDRDLHLFDTFEGMPPPTERDRRHDGRSAADLLATQGRNAKVWAIASLDDVRDGMLGLGYPADRVHFHRGLVEETVPAEAPEQISILRLDTDWYESTRHELEHLYHRLSPGGVLIIDDYGHWEGSRQAVEEFLDETGEPLLLLPSATGRITVKPGELR